MNRTVNRLQSSIANHKQAHIDGEANSLKVAIIPRTRSGHFFRVATLFNHLIGVEFKGSIEDRYIAAYLLPVSPRKEAWNSFSFPKRESDSHLLKDITNASELSVLSRGGDRPLLAEGSLCITDAPAELVLSKDSLKYALVTYVIPPVFRSSIQGFSLLGRGVASFLLRSIEEYSRSHGLELLGAKI